MLTLIHPCLDMPFRKIKKKNSVKWLVDRYPATISTWTDAEWERLTDKPSDAQRCDNGIWVALRMD